MFVGQGKDKPIHLFCFSISLGNICCRVKFQYFTFICNLIMSLYPNFFLLKISGKISNCCYLFYPIYLVVVNCCKLTVTH